MVRRQSEGWGSGEGGGGVGVEGGGERCEKEVRIILISREGQDMSVAG